MFVLFYEKFFRKSALSQKCSSAVGQIARTQWNEKLIKLFRDEKVALCIFLNERIFANEHAGFCSKSFSGPRK